MLVLMNSVGPMETLTSIRVVRVDALYVHQEVHCVIVPVVNLHHWIHAHVCALKKALKCLLTSQTQILLQLFHPQS